MTHTHIYTNIVEPKTFLDWLIQYVVDMTSPSVLAMFGKHAGYFVQLPTHNRPIPVVDLKVNEIPNGRQFRMDILSPVFGTPNYRFLFSIYFQPQGDLAQVQVWGWDTTSSTNINVYARLQERLEWNFPINNKSSATSVPSIDPNHPPTPDLDGWDTVFHWYYSIPRWICINLKALAEKIGYDYGTVMNRHSEYKEQYGERPMGSES